MSLKLVPPRKGRSPNYTVRGTYLRKRVNESTGTGELRIARRYLAKVKADIEAGTFDQPKGPTFAEAAIAYMNAGGERTYMTPLLNYFKERPLALIDQKAIDQAAEELYPNAGPATRNRHVYTPVSAVLKRAGINLPLKRPKGALGQQRTDWLWPEDAFRLFKEADKIDREFGLFLRFLTYTGLRLSEALNLEWRNVRLEEAFIYVPDTKSGDPRAVFTPRRLSRALADVRGGGAGRVFRFRKNGRLYTLLRAARDAAGLSATVNFHVLGRHTYATWMRMYAGLDVRGLVATGAWKDSQAASRYAHAVPTEEAKKAALLPVEDAWTVDAADKHTPLALTDNRPEKPDETET